jgi:type I restriction enzyme S subunit
MKQTPLNQLAIVSAGQAAPKDDEFSDHGIPFVRAGSLVSLLSGKSESDLELVSDATAKLRKLKTYPKGTILFAKSGMSATKDRIYVLQNPAYVVSHLATLIPNGNAHADYLRLALKRFPPSVLIKDPAYPAISLGDIQSYKIPVPDDRDDQIRIAHLLGKVEGLIAQRKQHLQQLDYLLKSVFLEMFGDPVRNEKGWDKPELKSFGKISTGNTPPRNEPANYDDDFIEWIKTDNITGEAVFVTPSTEHLSEVGARKARTVTNGALLVACIAGSVESIGRAALTDRTLSFNQQINAIQPGKDVNPIYLYGLFKLSRAYIQSHATKGMKKILTKGDFEKITMIKPPFEIQNQFAVIAEKVEGIKSLYQQSLTDLETLYAALSQQAFKGELDLSRVPLPAPAGQENQQAAIDLVPPQAETSPIPELEAEPLTSVLKSAPSLEEILHRWLEIWLNHLREAPFSVDDFMADVQMRLEKLQPDTDFVVGQSHYEHIKAWVFTALADGRLKQAYDDTGNRIQVKAANP